MVTDLPGVVTRNEANEVDGYYVPAGDYQIDVMGTGNGAASVAFFTSKGVRTYALTTIPMQQGTLKLHHGAVAGSFKFGAQKARATKGVPLFLAGLPATIPAKTPTQLVLTLTDALHAPAPAVTVAITGDGVSRHALTNAQGTVILDVVPKRAGKVRVKATGAGYVKLKQTLAVTG